jgi:outer membrane receptor protein involved in Fe transport
MRLPVAQADAGVAISVVTAADIEASGVRTVADALESLAGVAIVRSGRPGQTAAAFIRGVSADRILMLIDGVPVNDPTTTGARLDPLDPRHHRDRADRADRGAALRAIHALGLRRLGGRDLRHRQARARGHARLGVRRIRQL